MKVYHKIVMDMGTWEVLAEVAREYRGPVALAKGGSTVTNSYDPKYNAGVLNLSQQEWAVAQKWANFAEFGVTYNPNESVRGAMVNGQWVNEADLPKVKNPDYRPPRSGGNSDPYGLGAIGVSSTGVKTSSGGPEYIVDPSLTIETRTIGDINGYDPNAQVSEMQLIGQNLASQSELLPLQTSLAKSQIAADQQLIPRQTQLSLSQIDSELGLVPQRAALESTQLTTERGLVPKRGMLESTMIDSEMGLIPQRHQLESRQISTEMGLIPQRGQLESAQIRSELGLIPQRGELESATIADTMTGMKERAPVRKEFYAQALSGVDVNRRMNEGQADVEHAFGLAQKDFERGIFASGARAGGDAYTAALNEQAMAKAKGIAGARSQARTIAEGEMFKRLQSAVGAS